MKIADVRILRLSGVMEVDGVFWEERLIQPIDIYPEHKSAPREMFGRQKEKDYRVTANFLEIESDSGVIGIGGPLGDNLAYIIGTILKPMLLDQDPLAIERIWDRMYRASVHGRKGPEMMAISAVDCALWDLKGNHFDAPVCTLLGGPVRKEIPAYASALGYSLSPDLVAQRVQEFKAAGYGATKWFFRDGPTDGKAGKTRNEDLVRNLREAAGPNMDIMLDCWMSWDVPYTIDMAHRIKQYDPLWLEEPVMPDKISQYAQIRAASPVPISGGEHEYTRWGLKQLMDAQACDVLQPDIYWAGGISEVTKICALASAYDLPVIPHGHSIPASIHLIAAWPEVTCPMLEYLIKWNDIHQFFLAHPVKPMNGMVKIPTGPGMGMSLQLEKCESIEYVEFK